MYFSREENRSILTPPVVLISQGLGKVVFCDFPVLFQHSLQAIHGPVDDTDLLLFLTAYLRSDLANLLRADKEKLTLLKSRYPDTKKWLAVRAESAKRLHAKTNELIYKYFDIQPEGRWLIEDTVNVFMPRSTPQNPDEIDLPTLLPITQAGSVAAYTEGLKAYADALADTLNKWAEEQQSNTLVSARGGVDEASGLAFVKLEYGRKAASYKEVRFDSTVWKGLYKSFAEEQVAVRHERQLIGFLKDNAFYIVRPLSLMHWTRTAALNDADVFFGLEMRRQEGVE